MQKYKYYWWAYLFDIFWHIIFKEIIFTLHATFILCISIVSIV